MCHTLGMADKTGGVDVSNMTPEDRREFNRNMVFEEKGKRQSKKNTKIHPWAEKPANS